jgi:hypothetical protein
MKHTLILLLFSCAAWGQCICERTPELKDFINCDTTKFDNGASVYWHYNCDSSWFTFRNPKGFTTELYSHKELIGLTGRIGYSFANEYKTTFLIQNNLISGCCTPPAFILFDKLSGKLKEDLGRLIFYSSDKSKPFAVSFRDTTFNSLTLINFDNGKEFIVKLPKEQIKSAIKQLDVLAAEELFEDTIIKNNQIVLSYRYKKASDGKHETKTITIDLSKYSS